MIEISELNYSNYSNQFQENKPLAAEGGREKEEMSLTKMEKIKKIIIG